MPIFSIEKDEKLVKIYFYNLLFHQTSLNIHKVIAFQAVI